MSFHITCLFWRDEFGKNRFNPIVYDFSDYFIDHIADRYWFELAGILCLFFLGDEGEKGGIQGMENI
jgi:hypothetical protein